MNDDAAKRAFYRQSAWMMIANTGTGFLMFGVQLIGATWLSDEEYSLFGTMIGLLNLCFIPALGLQTVLAQQSSAVESEKDQHQLAATVRRMLSILVLFWASMFVLVLIFQTPIATKLKIDNRLILWITLVSVLPQLTMPILMGVLQGRQNFFWLGMVNAVNGLGRFVGVGVLIIIVGTLALGSMFGVLLGFLGAVVIGVWQSWDVLIGKGEPFNWRGCVERLVPLTFGLGASMVLLSADIVFVRSNFDEGLTGWYLRAGLPGRGLIMFTVPLAQVMFPKIIANAKSGTKSSIVMRTVVSTGILAVLVCGGMTVFSLILPTLSGWIIENQSLPSWFKDKFISNQEAIPFYAKFIPYFLWAMLPLTIANVLVNNLLAQKIYRAVPALSAVAILYLITLSVFHPSLEMVILTLAGFNLLLLLTAAFYSTTRFAAKSKTAQE